MLKRNSLKIEPTLPQQATGKSNPKTYIKQWKAFLKLKAGIFKLRINIPFQRQTVRCFISLNQTNVTLIFVHRYTVS